MCVLKGIDPLLSADLLHVLCSMGHGDTIVLCDSNFPASSTSSKTISKKHIKMSVPVTKAMDVICGVLPLDEDCPVIHMSPVNGGEMPPDGVEVALEGKMVMLSHSTTAKIESMERFDFYEAANKCYAIVETMETRKYGNFILTKGVI